jgi:4-diphosphocytidyl-2-C-methyl-D-erythritol kinase
MSRAAVSSVTLSAPAKINLTLDVLGRRPDGYHEIASIMHTISLADTVTVSTTTEGASFTLTVSGPEATGVPVDDRNLAWKAALAFGARDVAIHIEKRIPSQAGLGGGSSDAAATLLALNRLASSKLPRARLAEIGMKLGSDVPFFLHGGIARVEGRGEKVSRVPLHPNFGAFKLVIVKPPIGVSTADAYRLLDELPNRESANATARWPDSFENDFEEVIYFHYPEIDAAAEALRDAGVKLPHLCGSGSAVFGITQDAEQVAEKVKAAGVGRVYIAKPIGRGAQ